jgi:Flp pilus assembly protein TadD
MSVGRNEPCPCGSGSKFKHCCHGKGTNPLPRLQNAPVSPDARQLQALRRAARELFAAERFPEAITPLREAARIAPGSADAHYDLAVACIRSGRFPEAAESLREALKLRPGFQEAAVQLAQALEYLMAHVEAAAIHRRLSRTALEARRKLHHLAKARMLEGRLAEAETTLRRLADLDRRDGRVRTLLGQVLIDQGKFEEASAELRLAVETEPAAFHKLASARRIAPADRPLLERLHAMVKEAGVGAEEQTLILYGLGKAHDDLGEPEQAMACYDAANALRRSAARFDRAALARRYDDIIARYDAQSLKEAAASGSGDDRPILIVGLPRSGTTLVEQILSSHPELAAGGELQFWRVRSLELERGVNAEREPSAWKRAADDYARLLTRIGPGAQRVTDKAPLNLEALGLVLSALPRARVIHCRRAPIDTALSIYFTEFSSSLGFAFDRGDIVHAWRQYRRLMEHWREVLPPGRLLEIDYEDLVADPEPTIRRMVDFTGLPWNEACLAPERNDRVVKTASLWQVRQPIYKSSVERWRRYEPWLGELTQLISESRA